MPVSPARAAAFDILMRVEQGAFADELLHSERLDELSPADRALCTEIVMGVLRWRSLLDDVISELASRRIEKLDREVLNALRVGVYQLWRLRRVPAHAAINESVELVKRARKRSAAPFANAALRKLEQQIADRDISRYLASRGSPGTARQAGDAAICAHPPWLVDRWIHEFGLETARSICNHDQQVPVTTIRLRDSSVESELKQDGVQLSPGSILERARWVISGDITGTRAFAEGRIYIQDEASQLVALLVGNGTRILDCCAAPGGKTSVMAERNPNSLIVSADLHPARARLMRRLVKSGNVYVVAADAQALPLMTSFDRVLADVPCSGTGTLARNPEIKWRLRPEDLADLHRRQVSILSSALSYLSIGGRLVYSTCSLEREENEDVLAEVIAGRSDLRLLDCGDELHKLQAAGELVWKDVGSLIRGEFLRTLPGIHPCDGFFAAIIERVQ
jgi:16S rRNA (cytosine967-C5)-methyltransferase